MALGDTGQSPMACGIDQLPRATRARFQGLAVSTRSPGESRLGLMARGVDQLSCMTRASV